VALDVAGVAVLGVGHPGTLSQTLLRTCPPLLLSENQF
jgi:hypothetical protein